MYIAHHGQVAVWGPLQPSTIVRNMLRYRIIRKKRKKASDKMWSAGKGNYQVICGLLRLALCSLQAV